MAALSEPRWPKHLRGPAVAVSVAALMSLAGAFETWKLAPLPRFSFWLIVMMSGALLGIGASTGIRAWGRLSHRLVLEGAAVSVLVAVPQALLVTGTAALFFGSQIVSMDRALLLVASVFSVTIAVTTVNYLAGHAAGKTVPPVPSETAALSAATVPSDRSVVLTSPGPPRLSERLALHLRNAAIRALEAEDHYVRVHTAAGSDLLLLRMTDAIAELDGTPGARTHRSWWVARDAVTIARRFDGRGELGLADGTVVPVSRSALQQLQRDGWF